MFLNQTPVRTCKNYGINNIEINNLIFSGVRACSFPILIVWRF